MLETTQYLGLYIYTLAFDKVKWIEHDKELFITKKIMYREIFIHQMNSIAYIFLIHAALELKM
jgi:hypothetical protein